MSRQTRDITNQSLWTEANRADLMLQTTFLLWHYPKCGKALSLSSLGSIGVALEELKYNGPAPHSLQDKQPHTIHNVIQ